VAAHVERQREALDACSLTQFDELTHHARRQVVNAMESEILERLHRLAFARAGNAGHDDEAHEAHRTPQVGTMKLFSPEKVNALIPVVVPLLEELWSKRRALAIALLENDPALRSAAGRVRTPAARRNDARRLTELKADIVRMINGVEAHGCVVKDLDLGLLDFPAMRDGRPVYLCWKPGEEEVAYWHGTDETFVDRKEL
jgi:hypothetical protein